MYVTLILTLTSGREDHVMLAGVELARLTSTTVTSSPERESKGAAYLVNWVFASLVNEMMFEC